MATDQAHPSPAYPIPSPGDEDTRFTYGLIFDMADVLTRHGYPPPAGTDWAHLTLTLHRVLYQENT